MGIASEMRSTARRPQHQLAFTPSAVVLLDSDNDGRVTSLDVQSMLRRLGVHLPDSIVHNLVRQASRSGNALMNESEFCELIGRIQSLQCPTTSSDADETQKDLLSAFKVFDRDRNGYISREELKTAMDMIGESVTERGLNVLIATADVDKDGRINYEEF